MAVNPIRRRVIDQQDRTVVLTQHAWEHIVWAKPEMAKYEDEIMETITHFDDDEPDARPTRWRYFREGHTLWLRVIVSYAESENYDGEVVTAFWAPEGPGES